MDSLRPTLIALCLLPTFACGPAVENPGEETAGCNDGQCLEGLMCLSDVCVDPNGGTGTTGPDPTDSTTATTGPSTATNPTDGETETSADETGPAPEFSGELDILFLVDNSGSMGATQSAISESIGAFVDPLVDAGLSIRIAMTTSDDSNYWCQGSGLGSPENGQFVLSSCLGRLNDFYFSGTDENAESVCTDYCGLSDAELEIQPTSTELDPSSSPRPWVEVGPRGTNLPAGVSPTAALQCFLPQGINGCGFESTLESARKALLLADNPQQTQAGFLRSAAHLAVIFISDEADCSFNPEHQNTVFGEEGVGNQVFWSLPDQQIAPSSAVCWNAGVSCDFGLSSDQCGAVDLDVNGSPTANADDAALHPVSRFRDQLETLRAQKQSLGANVFAFGIVGVPEDYPSVQSINYAQGPNGNSPDSFQANFGIGPGCTSTITEAVPPVRMRELIEDSSFGSLHSVCQNDYAPSFSAIANEIATY